MGKKSSIGAGDQLALARPASGGHQNHQLSFDAGQILGALRDMLNGNMGGFAGGRPQMDMQYVASQLSQALRSMDPTNSFGPNGSSTTAQIPQGYK